MGGTFWTSSLLFHCCLVHVRKITNHYDRSFLPVIVIVVDVEMIDIIETRILVKITMMSDAVQWTFEIISRAQ